jgi:hypothetical protein
MRRVQAEQPRLHDQGFAQSAVVQCLKARAIHGLSTWGLWERRGRFPIGRELGGIVGERAPGKEDGNLKLCRPHPAQGLPRLDEAFLGALVLPVFGISAATGFCEEERRQEEEGTPYHPEDEQDGDAA